MKYRLTTALRFIKENVCIQGDNNGSKSSYGPVLHSYMWMSYSSSHTHTQQSCLLLCRRQIAVASAVGAGN
jgi:hypothetical protein